MSSYVEGGVGGGGRGSSTVSERESQLKFVEMCGVKIMTVSTCVHRKAVTKELVSLRYMEMLAMITCLSI